MRGIVRLLVLVAVTGVVAATPVRAQLSSATDSALSATCSGGGSTDGDCRNSVAFSTANEGTTFTSRYAWNINADTGVGSTHDTSGSARHDISFTATAPGGYRLDIVTSRFGDIQVRNDLTGCSGSADTGGVTGNSNIIVDVNAGALSLGDPDRKSTRLNSSHIPLSRM